MEHRPRTVEEIYTDYCQRRDGIIKALTDDVEMFFASCDPERENLCLYGERDGRWTVDLPAEEVPPELPEPCLGINFARDGMNRKDCLKLFEGINQHPTVFEIVSGRVPHNKNLKKETHTSGIQKKRKAGGEVPALGRERNYNHRVSQEDIDQVGIGTKAQLYWPDDGKWYEVTVTEIDHRKGGCKIQYSTGEFEELNLQEIVDEGHMYVRQL